VLMERRLEEFAEVARDNEDNFVGMRENEQIE